MGAVRDGHKCYNMNTEDQPNQGKGSVVMGMVISVGAVFLVAALFLEVLGMKLSEVGGKPKDCGREYDTL